MYLRDMFATLGYALSFQFDQVSALTSASRGWGIVLGIGILSGLSVIIGHSIILAINHLRGLSLALGISFFCVGSILQYVSQGVMIWVMGSLVLRSDPSIGDLVKLVLVSASPFVFGFLILLPCVGASIGKFLAAWMLSIMWGCTQAIFHASWYAALIVVGLSWLIMQIVSKATANPLRRLRDWLWLRMHGAPLLLSSQWIMDYYPSFSGRDEETGPRAYASLTHTIGHPPWPTWNRGRP